MPINPPSFYRRAYIIIFTAFRPHQRSHQITLCTSYFPPHDQRHRKASSMMKTNIIAILDLPPKSSLSLDGQPLVLQRDDFVGFHQVPMNDASMHLVTARAGPPRPGDEAASVTVAFIIQSTMLIKRFDRETEEVSAHDVDAQTSNSLLEQIAEGRIGPQRLVVYDTVVPLEKQSLWKESTNCISKRLLAMRRIREGGKLVAGSYQEEPSTIMDGSPVWYPDIPIIEESQRPTRHTGTKKFLSHLTPTERTALFTSTCPADLVFDMMLRNCYNNNWKDMVGDIQLSYLLFLHLHCFSSLEHWRDLVATLSLVSPDAVKRRPKLFPVLLQSLYIQILSMEKEFFEEMELSGANFLVPALSRFSRLLAHSNDESIIAELDRFNRLVRDRFPVISDDEDPVNESPQSGESDSEENGPAIVSSEDVADSLARFKEDERLLNPRKRQANESSLRQRYPFLMAAVMPHEDILMTCARALHDKSDVTLVREAAAYLEEVETSKQGGT